MLGRYFLGRARPVCVLRLCSRHVFRRPGVPLVRRLPGGLVLAALDRALFRPAELCLVHAVPDGKVRRVPRQHGVPRLRGRLVSELDRQDCVRSVRGQ